MVQAFKRGLLGAPARFALAVLALGMMASSGCMASKHETLTVAGVQRDYYVYVPKSVTAGTTVPVVYVLHPLTKDAAWAERTMGWDQCADKNGFIVVYGQSAALSGVWDAGLTRAERSAGYDDVAYLVAVMDAVDSEYLIDMSHVYMVGFSSGANMAAKMGASIPNSLTAIGTVEGITGFSDQDVLVPKSPLSAIMFRGTSDEIVPYTSDVTSALFRGTLFSAVGTAEDWAAADGCSKTPATSKATNNIDLTDYTGGTGGAEVQLMTVNGGRHVYKPEDTDLIWGFFKTQSKVTIHP